VSGLIVSTDDPPPARPARKRGFLHGLARLIRRLLWTAVIAVLGLLAPVAYVELFCRGEPLGDNHQSLLPPEERRPESNTLLTYPEWHIVHAYDDYAEVIRTGDPHDFGYLRAIGGFWSSLCSLNRVAAEHGGPSPDYRTMVHVVGVSFTAELLLKAAYEETVGRVATWIRGPQRSRLDDLSARQAAGYASFLQQVPWYRWDFDADREALDAAATGGVRDQERALALGLEYRAKAAYAQAIAAAVAATGGDTLTMRSIVSGLSPEALEAFADVTVIGERPEGVEIETPRYRAFTKLARTLARAGGDFVEIAGNDDILVTAIAEAPAAGEATVLASLPRQGNPGVRELRFLRVADLGDLLRDDRVAVEHIHDY
jgi:hypothetical protein